MDDAMKQAMQVIRATAPVYFNRSGALVIKDDSVDAWDSYWWPKVVAECEIWKAKQNGWWR